MEINRWFGFELSIDGRRGLETESENGTVVATAIGGSTAAIARFFGGQPWWFGIGARIRAAYLVYDGTPVPGRLGFRRETLLLAPRGELMVGLASGAWVARVTVGVGAPLVSGRATDDGSTVSAAAGLELSALAGFGFRL